MQVPGWFLIDSLTAHILPMLPKHPSLTGRLHVKPLCLLMRTTPRCVSLEANLSKSSGPAVESWLMLVCLAVCDHESLVIRVADVQLSSLRVQSYW